LDEYVNALTALVQTNPDSPAAIYAAHALPLVIAPFAPHIAEELWERMGHKTSVHLERFLEPNEEALALDEITLVVQVNGKIRARLQVAPGISEDDAFTLAMDQPAVQAQLDGKQIRKRIYVPDKLLNLVVG
jgi:leucyl-tRNA synthetase